MIKTTPILPEDYSELFSIDLQKNKKLAVLVNALGLLLSALMFALGFLKCSITVLFEFNEFKDNLIVYFLPSVSILLGIVLYIFLHEFVHGIFMRAFSKVRPKYGFTGLYAYAGSSAYFNKLHYIIIALAPIVIWGIILGIACIFLNGKAFWVVYFIQIINISGAAGDIYVTFKFLRLPNNILVNDTGVAMTVYTKQI